MGASFAQTARHWQVCTQPAKPPASGVAACTATVRWREPSSAAACSAAGSPVAPSRVRSADPKLASGRNAGIAQRGLVVADDFGDDEVEKLLRELRIQFGVGGKGPESGNLVRFAVRICRRQTVPCLEFANLLGDLEPLREQVHQGGIHVVDAVAQPTELSGHDVIHGSKPNFWSA